MRLPSFVCDVHLSVADVQMLDETEGDGDGDGDGAGDDARR